MNIVLVGADGAGKSSVTKALGDKLRWAMLHTQWEMFGRNGIEETYVFEDNLLKESNHIIVDRHSGVESLVYRPHFAYHVPDPTEGQLQTLRQPHNLVVYLTYDAADIVGRKGDDEHLHMISAVHAEFEQTLIDQNIKYITVNTSGRIPEDVADEIVSHIPVSELTKAPDRGFSKDA